MSRRDTRATFLAVRWREQDTSERPRVPKPKQTIMPKYTSQDKARILAQARRHLVGHRTEALRKKNALLLEKAKVAERQKASERQQGSRTSGVPGYDRDLLVDLIGRAHVRVGAS